MVVCAPQAVFNHLKKVSGEGRDFLISCFDGSTELREDGVE